MSELNGSLNLAESKALKYSGPFHFSSEASIIKAMKRLLCSSLTIVLLSSCSLYKSDGRKQFESDAPGKIKTASVSFQLKGCKKESAIESWLNSEFPATSYEMDLSDSDLEIWHTTQPGPVEVKAIQKSETTAVSTCTYQFADKATWESYRDSFTQELQNNFMSPDESP